MPKFINIVLGNRESYSLYSNIIKFLVENGADI